MYTESPKEIGCLFHEAKAKSPNQRNGEVESEKDFLILFQCLLPQQRLEQGLEQGLELDANLKNYCAPQEELVVPDPMIDSGGEENTGKGIGNIFPGELSQAGKKFMPGILGGTGVPPHATGISAEETSMLSAGISTEETSVLPAAGTSTEIKVEMNMGSGKESAAFQEQLENHAIIRQSLHTAGEPTRQGTGDIMLTEDRSWPTAQGEGSKEQKETGKVTAPAIEPDTNLSIYRTLTDAVERTGLERLPAKIQSLLSVKENSGRPKTLELKLEPETLGTVRVTVNWTKGEISARFFAQSESAAALLSSGMQLLKENLNRMQINITGLSVAVAGGQGKETGPSGAAFKRERNWGERDKSFSGTNRLRRQNTGAPSVNLLI